MPSRDRGQPAPGRTCRAAGGTRPQGGRRYGRRATAPQAPERGRRPSACWRTRQTGQDGRATTRCGIPRSPSGRACAAPGTAATRERHAGSAVGPSASESARPRPAPEKARGVPGPPPSRRLPSSRPPRDDQQRQERDRHVRQIEVERPRLNLAHPDCRTAQGGEQRRVEEAFEPGLHLAAVRSEEHTSELQSRFDLVCRLLLEKKKKKKKKKHNKKKKKKKKKRIKIKKKKKKKKKTKK